MEKDKQRKSTRINAVINTFIRKSLPDGGERLIQFITKDLSETGVFVLTEDLNVFDLGDEVNILVDKNGERYFEGNAKIVRSERTFTESREQTESGFGLMFLETNEEFEGAISELIDVQASKN